MAHELGSKFQDGFLNKAKLCFEAGTQESLIGSSIRIPFQSHRRRKKRRKPPLNMDNYPTCPNRHDRIYRSLWNTNQTLNIVSLKCFTFLSYLQFSANRTPSGL